MKNKLIKISTLSSILLLSIFLVACTDKGTEEPTQEKVWEEVGVIEKELFDENEKQFFKIAFNMNQLINKTNNFILFYENELQHNKNLNELINLKEQIKQDSDALYKELEESRTFINELKYSRKNETHDKALESVITELEKGLKEYEFSLNYYNEFLISAFDFKTEEERVKNVESYLETKKEYEVVLKGHIEKMQNNFEIASQKFVIEIGLFKKDYDVNVYTTNLDKYFEEHLNTEK